MTGRDLESAILSAAKIYQAQDRCELAKQHTPRLHSGQYMSKAPVDFKGWYGPTRRPLYVEAKATSDGHVAFTSKGDGINEKQLDAMRDAVKRGIDMYLVVAFVPESEVYVVNAISVVSFADAPWRKSLTLFWCRAVGLLARYDGKRVWFLDGTVHPLQATAQEAVKADRVRHGGEIVELFPIEIARRASARSRRLAEPMPRPGTPEYAARMADAFREGTERQLRNMRGKRKQRWNPR